MAFLTEELSEGDEKAVTLISKWEAMGENKTTLFNAKRAMEEDGLLVVDDSKKPKVWHLNASARAREGPTDPDRFALS